MKVKACPSIDTVRGILQERIGESRRLLDEDNTELAKLTSSDQVVYNPYLDTNIAKLKASVASKNEYLKLRETELILLQSHLAPQVMVEIEV